VEAWKGHSSISVSEGKVEDSIIHVVFIQNPGYRKKSGLTKIYNKIFHTIISNNFQTLQNSSADHA